MNKIILGTWGLAGKAFIGDKPIGYGHVSHDALFSTLECAHNHGILQLDTAPNYGNGKFYENLLAWQQTKNTNFKLTVKIGRFVKENHHISSYTNTQELIDNFLPIYQRFPNSVSHLLIKDPPKKFICSGEIMNHLGILKQSFPNLTIGFSTHAVKELANLPALSKNKYVIQLEFNALNFFPIQKEIIVLKNKFWHIWGMQPLAYGFLSGKYNKNSKFSINDWRSSLNQATKNIYVKLAASFHESFLKNENISKAQKALVFCMANTLLDGIIIGPKNTMQLQDALTAIEFSKREVVKNAFEERQNMIHTLFS
jgi:aryl-alcohol dehydrogenase-like predicted oxidoreductase